MSCFNENKELSKLLIRNGADINALDQNKKSVLDYVLDNNAPILAEWLIKKGAKRGKSISE